MWVQLQRISSLVSRSVSGSSKVFKHPWKMLWAYRFDQTYIYEANQVFDSDHSLSNNEHWNTLWKISAPNSPRFLCWNCSTVTVAVRLSMKRTLVSLHVQYSGRNFLQTTVVSDKLTAEHFNTCVIAHLTTRFNNHSVEGNKVRVIILTFFFKL